MSINLGEFNTLTLPAGLHPGGSDWRRMTVPPRTFTITLTGTPKLSEPTPTIDTNDPETMTRLDNAALTPIEDVPLICGCDETCGACATDAADPGPLTSNVAVLIEIKECTDDPRWYMAQSEQFSQFGQSATPYDALRDFFATMADHMAFLQQHEMTLSRGLANELGFLRTLAGNGRI